MVRTNRIVGGTVVASAVLLVTLGMGSAASAVTDTHDVSSKTAPASSSTNAEFTAVLDRVDASAKLAFLSGTGESGARVEITGPLGEQVEVVTDDGTWAATVPLVEGDNNIDVSVITANGQQFNIIVVPAPVADPAIALGVMSVLSLGSLAVFKYRRRHG